MRRPWIIAAIVALGALAFVGKGIVMSYVAERNQCIDVEDWPDALAFIERGVSAPPAPPFRDLTLRFELPFDADREDTLVVHVIPSIPMSGSPIRDQVTVYDGHPSGASDLSVRLPATTTDDEEIYTILTTLIRPARRQVCGWQMEEEVLLPPPPHPTRWRVELLPGRVPTDDGGGSRTTRIAPLG